MTDGSDLMSVYNPESKRNSWSKEFAGHDCERDICLTQPDHYSLLHQHNMAALVGEIVDIIRNDGTEGAQRWIEESVFNSSVISHELV